MANEQNLKTLSPKEAREQGSKGGKASGAARRRKKNLQETAKAIAALPLNELGLKRAQLAGVDISSLSDDDMTALTAVVLGQIKAASRGDARAAQIVAEWLDLASTRKKNKLEMEKLKAEIERLKSGQMAEGDDDMVLQFIKGMKERGD